MHVFTYHWKITCSEKVQVLLQENVFVVFATGSPIYFYGPHVTSSHSFKYGLP